MKNPHQQCDTSLDNFPRALIRYKIFSVSSLSRLQQTVVARTSDNPPRSPGEPGATHAQTSSISILLHSCQSSASICHLQTRPRGSPTINLQAAGMCKKKTTQKRLRRIFGCRRRIRCWVWRKRLCSFYQNDELTTEILDNLSVHLSSLPHFSLFFAAFTPNAKQLARATQTRNSPVAMSQT